MRDLSLHVLDIAQNSIKAGAKLVSIAFEADENGALTLTVADDGCGMSPELLQRVIDPFTTTRTTRKVGLGIPMLKHNAEATGGSLDIQSEPGVGTTLRATLHRRHIDCPPMGAICDTLLTLIVLNPDTPDFVFEASAPGMRASFDTRVIRQAAPDVPLNAPELIEWMKASIEEEFKPILEV